MPKLKAVAAKGKGDVTALIEGMENQTEGMQGLYKCFVEFIKKVRK